MEKVYEVKREIIDAAISAFESRKLEIIKEMKELNLKHNGNAIYESDRYKELKVELEKNDYQLDEIRKVIEE